MMMRARSLLQWPIAGIGVVILAGCTPADCDPNRAELFAGIGCSASGSYAARETSLRNNLAASQANELQRQADASRAGAQAAAAQQDLNRRRAQLAMLDGRLAALQRQLDEARQRQGIDQAALHNAETRLATLQARRARVSPQSNDADVGALDGPTRDLSETLRREGF
jgi:chromosome segregation ATPase